MSNKVVLLLTSILAAIIGIWGGVDAGGLAISTNVPSRDLVHQVH